jgi:hypothetical protein
MFLASAFWNWVVAAILWFTYEAFFRYLGQGPLAYALPFQIALGMVFVYGIGYFYLYKDQVTNRQIAKLGVYGKTAVFTLLVNAWLAGEIVFVLVIPGIVDLIFAVLFLEFLISTGHFSLTDKLHGIGEVVAHARAVMTHRSAH